MIWVLLILGVTGYGAWWSGMKVRAYDKYEFENRSSGGVVAFKTFEQGEKHNHRKSLLTLLRNGCGIVFILVGAASCAVLSR